VLWNVHGAVETTAYATLARVEQSVPVTVGRPIANTRVYVLDAYNRPVPVGVTGELLVAGDGVAAGYLNRTDLAAEAFVDDPFGPGSAYRTGDLARWLPDGQVELALTQDRS
jgi:non-ribosomal peptide synthetase component F